MNKRSAGGAIPPLILYIGFSIPIIMAQNTVHDDFLSQLLRPKAYASNKFVSNLLLGRNFKFTDSTYHITKDDNPLCKAAQYCEHVMDLAHLKDC